jgi:nucleoside-diphosphate-sugar epimerase
MARAFVTGGSGFIGRALIRRLIAEGHFVTAFARSDDALAVVAALGADPVLGQLADSSTYAASASGSDVFFHLAAQTDVAAALDAHVDVTVNGTSAALDAARSASVPIFVHTGTEAALLAGDPLVEVDETAPLRPDSPAHYSATKALPEQMVLDADSQSLRTTVVRPRFVWGWDSNLIGALVGLVQDGKFAWIEGGHVTTDVTHVDNAVEGHLLAWHHGAGGQAYFVTDDQRADLRDFLTEQFDAYGVDAPTADLTRDEAAALVDVPFRWFLGQECTLVIDKAKSQLGYNPLRRRDEAVAEIRRLNRTEADGTSSE